MDKQDEFRILIIDDNLDIHNDFIKTLTSVNTNEKLEDLDKLLFGSNSSKSMSGADSLHLPKFQIDTATQGQEGVEKILEAIKRNQPYALAFVDIRMPPGWDGIETIKHIWELDKNIQIVICTAYSDYTWEETVAELGQTDNLLILKKPFDYITVRQLASALTRKWQLMLDSKSYTESLEETVHLRTTELQFQATHDSLTGLPNRVFLEKEIKDSNIECERKKSMFAIFFFDLDRFKLVNDSLSHSAGDELLKIVSKRLLSNIRGSNTLARIGGDEFILLIRDIENPSDAAKIATTLLNIISQPMVIADHTLSLTSSIGICIYPNDGNSLEELIKNADIAMYKSKELGGNQFHYYVSEMNEDAIKMLVLESEMRHAIDNNEFFLVYQPQFDLKSNTLIGVEALVRWNHPTRGVLLPIDFIKLAEDSGLIILIGEWVLREACRQNKKWQEVA